MRKKNANEIMRFPKNNNAILQSDKSNVHITFNAAE